MESIENKLLQKLNLTQFLLKYIEIRVHVSLSLKLVKEYDCVQEKRKCSLDI